MKNISKFQIIDTLGKGSFGSAYKVIDKDNNKIYVIKQISLKNSTKKEIESIKNEAKILSSINSEYVVKYFDSFIENDYFNIVMEYCNGLDLRKLINSYKENNKFIEKEKIYHFIDGLCQGIQELHKKKLIHRDLKPENIFLTGNYKIKIGDFGISKQLNEVNDFAKTQIGTISYMAPEMITGEKYNNKIDIWALGCIIYELCTLECCFDGLSKKIKEINIKLYGNELQNLINVLLNKNYKKRPNIEEVIKTINNNEINNNKNESFRILLLQSDEFIQNFLIEEFIQLCLDRVSINMIHREESNSTYIYYSENFLSIFSIYIGIWFFFGMTVASLALIPITLPISFGFAILMHYKLKGKQKFLIENEIIIEKIQNELFVLMNNKLEDTINKEKEDKIIIYSQNNFENKIKRIKQKLVKKKLDKLKKVVRNNFNIILVGCTNAGKSTLINEFLNLDKDNRARESIGGPTEIDLEGKLYFKPYIGKNNNKQYTLYDSNGITNSGKDSIENKISVTKEEIEKRIKKGNPNNLIHCIWYCIEGSNIQQSDGDFIRELLSVYSTYSIPIIFIHTQTYNEEQSETCKKGLRKYLLQIFNNDEKKTEEYLENYIEILARGTKNLQPFGLDKLEKITRNEIEIKGFKSSYFELIKGEVTPILLNGAFNLVFNEYNINQLASKVTKNIDKYLKTILDILNDENLELNEEIKNRNKETINRLYNHFKDEKENIKGELNKLLDIKQLKKNNEEFIKIIYENKDEKYKKDMDFKKFSKNVENLIYDNLFTESKKHINNLINIGFNNFVIQKMKKGIEIQFEQMQENVIKQIYSELFKE